MIAMITTVLVAGLVAMITVTAHEIFEHSGPVMEHRGADEQWADELHGIGMQLPRTARGRRHAQ